MFDLIPMSGREGNIWNFFDNWEKHFFQNTQPYGNFSFRTDIAEEADKFLLSAELPGLDRENIHIDIDRDMLTITAGHSEENEDKRGNYIRRERRTGSYARSFNVSGINTDAISAKYENGLLTLSLPKKEAALPPPARRIEIQ